VISAIFFIWFAVATFWTVNALRRPVPPGRRMPPLWLPGMIVSELAPWFLVERFIVAGALIWAGALGFSIGIAGLALFALCQVGLLILMRRSILSARHAGYRASFLDLWKVRVRAPEAVEVETEVPYSAGLTVDVYRRASTDEAPTLIYLHPGSWMRGRPGRQALGMLYDLADRGWVVLDARYPLSPVATFPDHLIGIKRLIAWARDTGGRFGVDSKRIAIAGGSSGAHLAALAALTWDDQSLQPGFEEADTSLMACAPHYGIYDLLIRNATRFDWPFISKYVMKTSPGESPDVYRRASPLDLVRPDAPPFFAVHGEYDSVVLAEESRQFVRALQNVGARVQYHEVPGAQHGFDAIPSIRTRAVGALVRDFLLETAAFEPSPGAARPGVSHPESDDST
jgi:acetyl esterase/lipase